MPPVARRPDDVDDVDDVFTELSDVLAALSSSDRPTQLVPLRTHRAALLAATDETMPHGPYLSRLARLFDLDFDQIVRVVIDLADPARWKPTPLPTVRRFRFEGGPLAVHTEWTAANGASPASGCLRTLCPRDD